MSLAHHRENIALHGNKFKIWNGAEGDGIGVGGVYCIFLENKELSFRILVYIGCSNNIWKRLLSVDHVYVRMLHRIKPPFELTVKYRYAWDYRHAEMLLIYRLNPILNSKS